MPKNSSSSLTFPTEMIPFVLPHQESVAALVLDLVQVVPPAAGAADDALAALGVRQRVVVQDLVRHVLALRRRGHGERGLERRRRRTGGYGDSR